jgi:hypothetical protein
MLRAWVDFSFCGKNPGEGIVELDLIEDSKQQIKIKTNWKYRWRENSKTKD